MTFLLRKFNAIQSLILLLLATFKTANHLNWDSRKGQLRKWKRTLLIVVAIRGISMALALRRCESDILFVLCKFCFIQKSFHLFLARDGSVKRHIDNFLQNKVQLPFPRFLASFLNGFLHHQTFCLFRKQNDPLLKRKLKIWRLFSCCLIFALNHGAYRWKLFDFNSMFLNLITLQILS